MTDDHGHLAKPDHFPKALPECLKPGEIVLSPLGWSIKGRLIWVFAVSVFLWLSVAWALGWL
jgi:hypothetical protein